MNLIGGTYEKIHKIELYMVDYNNQFGTVGSLINYLADRTDCMYHVGNSQTVEFEWNDDLDINNIDATTKDYEEYFK